MTLLPVRVQGTEAPGEIAGAIDYANRYHVADLILTGRGGGSIEDLWAFNEEIVARAIYRSEIPVISAVGHEPDVTIADYVADVRAATPSNGAELAVPDQGELRTMLRGYETRLLQSMGKRLKLARQQLETKKKARVLQSPTRYLEDRRQRLDGLMERLGRAMLQRESLGRGELLARRQRLESTWKGNIHTRQQRAGTLAARLDAMSPLKVLARGYSITETASGCAVRSGAELRPGDSIQIRFSQGRARATVEQVMED